jgi:hypothetical protein
VGGALYGGVSREARQFSIGGEPDLPVLFKKRSEIK